MVFDAKDFAQIFADMRDRTSSRITDFEEGSVVRTLYESFSYELALLYEQMHRVYLSAYVNTATGGQLDQVVAILGIKRGEPDFASGLVTFERDLGIEEPIEIPLGFLVTTSEDTEENPKKSFQTIEPKTLLETDKTVQVRVQATQRGESQATEADTIQVMPQPLPGVKTVTNEQAIRFVGKRRETDEELRDRAKTALLAASGANITAIENALFSLPGVTEVRVRENFHYARGKVKISRGDRRRRVAVTVPKGTELRLQAGARKFTTLATLTLAGDVTEATVDIEAQTRGMAGQRSEDDSPWVPLEQTDSDNNMVTLQVSDVTPIVLRDFGVLEVFVDGVDFNNTNQMTRLQQEIERVRAAGVYVLLKPAQTVSLDAIFQIELTPGKRVDPAERMTLEETLQSALKTYISDQRMGQPLLISQITKQILEPSLVSDVVDFKLISYRREGDYQRATEHNVSTKRLEVEILEKIVPRYIRVASETKPLPVNVEVRVSSLGDDDASEGDRPPQNKKSENIEKAIWDYFSSLGTGVSVRKTPLQAKLAEHDITDAAITLVPEFWQPITPFDGDTVEVSFVEQAQLGNVFIYERTLDLNGALKLMLSLTATQAEKDAIQQQVRVRIEAYLNHLKPEENVDVAALAEVAQAVDGVLQVDWRIEDFRISVTQGDTTTPVANRIDGTVIQVNPFEKTRVLPEFAIATDIQRIPIEVTQLTLRLDLAGLIPEPVNPSHLQTVMIAAVRHTLNTIHQELTQPAIAQPLDPEAFANDLRTQLQAKVGAMSRSMIQSLDSVKDIARDDTLADYAKTFLRGATYTIEQLNLSPNGTDLVIRLVEQAQIQPINGDDTENITITIELPIPPSP